MAAILASHSCNCRNVDLMNQGRTLENLSFTTSISIPFAKFEKPICKLHSRNSKFQVQMRQTESPASRSGDSGNGRAIKMVPVSEVMKRKTPNGKEVKVVNGAKQVNGTKQVVNGVNIIKRESGAGLVKTSRYRQTNKFPPLEDSKVLPTDEGFSWANENYNNWQRTIDVWSFVLSLRIRVLFDNEKWAYLGGFTEEKQVIFFIVL